MKNNPASFSREKSRQMGLVMANEKVRTGLGVPVMLAPVISQ